MHKLSLQIFLLFVAFALPSFAFAEGERIDAFHVQVTLVPNGSALVQEEIVYDFGAVETPHHGIYRKIPLTAKVPGWGSPRTIEISSIMVTDGTGRLLRAEYSGGGNFMQLKIGEPDVLVSGRQRYVIKYTVWGAINQSYPDRDEFYWNVTGDTWDVPIGVARADVALPLPLKEDKVTTTCLVGPVGGLVPCVASSTPQEGTGVVNSVRFTYADTLFRNEGLTAIVSIPKGIYVIAPTSKLKTLAKSVGVYRWWRGEYLGWSAAMPVLLLLVLVRAHLYGGVSRGSSHPSRRPTPATFTHYAATSLVLILCSFFLPFGNFALLVSGCIMLAFALVGFWKKRF